MTIGRNLLNAATVLKAASKQIEELFGEFSNHLAGTRTSGGIGFRASKDPADAANYMEGWAQDGWRLTLVATEGGKRARKGHEYGEVTIAVDLGREGWLAEKVGEACIYVFWAAPSDTWTESIDGSEFFPTPELYSIVDDQIFFWTDVGEDEALTEADFRADPLNNTWFFVVPLTKIDTRRKVHDLLAGPIVNLLEGKFEQLEALHPALRFSWQGDEPAVLE